MFSDFLPPGTHSKKYTCEEVWCTHVSVSEMTVVWSRAEQSRALPHDVQFVLCAVFN